MIGKGAEANLYLEGDIVSKERISKAYRESVLDDYLRRSRTKREAKLISLARRAGVATPFVTDVDVASCTIEMRFVTGMQVKKLLPSLSKDERRGLCAEIGRCAGRLHSNHIIHGDLTTSNMILHKDKTYFIDFGLGEVSEAVEDKGVDLLVFKKALHSTHFKYKKECWEGFVEGYSKAYKGHKDVLQRLRAIERRGRYFAER